MHGIAGFWQDLTRDLSGKGQFRLILQPLMAIVLGIRLGVADAKEGSAPFGLRLFTEHHRRWTLFKESLSDAVLPLCVALVMDSVLQYLTLGYVRIVAAFIVGGVLVWLPFIAARGFTNRFWRRTHRPLVGHKH